MKSQFDLTKVFALKGDWFLPEEPMLTLVRRLEKVLFENENQYAAWKDSTLATVAK